MYFIIVWFLDLFYCGILFQQSSASIAVVDKAGQGFDVNVDGIVILNHTFNSPVLFLGRGSTNFREYSGNFLIDDYITEKVGLPAYDVIKNSDGSWDIVLSRGDDKAILSLSQKNASQPVRLSVNYNSTDFWDRIWLRVAAEYDEKVYGGGEQFSFFNLRHRDDPSRTQNVFPIWTSEQGVGRNKSTQVTFFADNLGKGGGDYYTTYFPQPTFVSSRKFYFHHTGANYAVLDFRADLFHEIKIHGVPGDIYISTGGSLMEVVTSLTSMLGLMPKLADWVQQGAILASQGGTDTMLSRYNDAKQHGVPVAGLWIQDWSGTQTTTFGKRVIWNWEWDPTHYPGLDNVIGNLSAEGVRVLGYINPNLGTTGSLFKEAKDKGYLVKNSSCDVYIMTSVTLQFGSVDLTNPDAFNWYKEVIKKNMIGLGLGGWMADFGEYLPVDAVLYNGVRGIDVHNDYPRLWALCNLQAVVEANKLDEIVYFSRSGYTGIGKSTPLMWAGDQNVDFSLADGVRSSIIGALSMAMSGVGTTHFDIGGYTTYGTLGLRRTQELFLRSAELAIFGPVFRTHEGNQPSFNVQWYSNSTIDKFAKLAQAFASLKEYRLFVTGLTSTKGIPAQRPFILHHEDSGAPDTQFYFGPDVIVAPVYQQGVESTMVMLPIITNGDRWVHIWTGKLYDGGHTYKVMTPIGSPAAFYRSGSSYKTVFERLQRLHNDDGIIG